MPNPSYPTPTGTQPPEKKKGGCFKWFLSIVGIFLLIGLIAQACGGSTDSSSAGRTESTSPRLTATTSAAPSTTPAGETELQPPSTPGSPAVPAPAGTPAAQDVPREYRNALRQAERYVNTMAFSKARLYDQLTSEYGEQFPEDAAQYAIDTIQADWNAEALESARSYSEQMGLSDAALYDQLTSDYGEGFTAEQAQYAIDNL